MKILLLLALFVSVSASADWECASVMGPVPFTGNWVFTDGANFVAGDLPQWGRTHGSLQVTHWEVTGEWNGQSYGGLVSFRASGFVPGALPPYFAYPAGSGRPMGPFYQRGIVNVDGTVRLSMAARQEIRRAIESGLLRLPGVDPANVDLNDVCVSDLAMNVGRMNRGFGGQLRGGSIFLFLNRTRASFEMRF